MIKKVFIYSLFLTFFCGVLSANDSKVNIKLDVTEVPHLEKWGLDAKKLAVKWYPRIVNLIPTKGHKLPKEITLKIKKTDKGIAFASGTKITISSGWVDKHPGDIGLVVHELVHVIQGYPNGNPGWLVEGIADYLRWAIYQGKTQKGFNRPKKAKGYKNGYQTSAGFLLWLESEVSPGIINKLNTKMRHGKYSDELFKSYTQKSLDELWTAYINFK